LRDKAARRMAKAVIDHIRVPGIHGTQSERWEAGVDGGDGKFKGGGLSPASGCYLKEECQERAS
jgi:hypothetical protein